MDEARYRYQAEYISDFVVFRDKVLDKTVIPHQVEFQPGPAGSKICWLECPYCYGGSAYDTGERLPRDRAVEVLKEVLAGGVHKIIFAGYATDPLFSPDIEDLVEVAVGRGATVGFNTKALRVSDKLTMLLTDSRIGPRSYVSISVDAASTATYRAVHNAKNAPADIYQRVRKNAAVLASTGIEVAATYLVNQVNASQRETRDFVSDFRAAGCRVIRFAFPQLPRGAARMPTVPSEAERRAYSPWLRALAVEQDSDACRVLFVDADQEHEIHGRVRTVPCVARWVFPTVGFDGWLYHCSQSAAPNFRTMALGNLAERGFWECFYDYDVSDLRRYFDRCTDVMEASGCRCDRKEHLVNAGVARSGVFTEAPLLRIA